MPIYTSSHFASVIAEGTDWRDTSKKVLEQIESVKTADDSFNIGFLYISDVLAPDAGSILNLFRSVTKIDHWVGTIGIGVCGTNEEYIDAPAISAMVGRIPADQFAVFPAYHSESDMQDFAPLQDFLKRQDPMLVLTHGDSTIQENPDHVIRGLEEMTGGFLIGGLSSSRAQHHQFANDMVEGGFSGMVFSQEVPVMSTLSQGCRPIGASHIVTKAADNVIIELDDRPASEVFEEDIRTLIIKTIDTDPDHIVIGEHDLHERAAMPQDMQSLLQGEIDIAFPVSNSDQNDYLVRNITGIDSDDGTITITDIARPGDRVFFVRRNRQSIEEDLTASLLALRKRLTANGQPFQPKGAIYVSCIARAFAQDGSAEDEPSSPHCEMPLVHDILGDIPIAGFYASGEINNARFYGYTSIIILFL